MLRPCSISIVLLVLPALAGCHTLLHFGSGGRDAAVVDGPPRSAAEMRPVGNDRQTTGEALRSDRNGLDSLTLTGECAPLPCVTTVAGDGVFAFRDGPAQQAQFRHPHDVVIDGVDLYIPDEFNHRIRKISGGVVSTVFGSGATGCAPGTAKLARLNEPHQLVVVAAAAWKAIYLADAICNTIWKWTGSATGGDVIAFAGPGAAATPGYADGPLAQALFSEPGGLAVHGPDLLIADYMNNRIRRIEQATGSVSTFAGSGQLACTDGDLSAAAFTNPISLQVGPSGKIYVVDQGCAKIRVIQGNTVTTLAGDGTPGFAEGPAASARFNRPSGLAVDKLESRVYVADTFNHCIRKIEGGLVSTIAGTCSLPFGFQDGPAASALFYRPYGVALESPDHLLVADELNNRIRRIHLLP